MTEKRPDQEALQQILGKTHRHGGNEPMRVVKVSVSGKEISMAHVIGVSEPSVYKNLGLDIGTHAGEDFKGMSIGTIHMSPPEATVIAADIAVKAGYVELGFLDRFSGTLILTGPLEEVKTAVFEIMKYFREELQYKACPVTVR